MNSYCKCLAVPGTFIEFSPITGQVGPSGNIIPCESDKILPLHEAGNCNFRRTRFLCH